MNSEALEFCISLSLTLLSFPNISCHTFLHGGHEIADFGRLSFRFQMDAAIGQILHKTRHLKLLGDLQSLVTKPDSLDASGEKGRNMMHFWHSDKKVARCVSTQHELVTVTSRILFARITHLSSVFTDATRRLHYMTNSDSDGLFDNDWEERGELSWTEKDWQKYLAEQEDAVRDYIKHYDQLGNAPDRIDEVARRMGWEMTDLSGANDEIEEDEEETDESDEESFESEWDPYTLHRNPVYIATRSLYLSLIAHWERIAVQPGRVPSALGITLLSSLYKGNEQVMQAVQALEMGDYTLAVCLFKLALRELNQTLARLSQPDVAATPLAMRYREYALPRLFDLREIWLRVMSECRQGRGDDSASE